MPAETLVYTTWQDWVERSESLNRLQQFAPGDTEEDHPRVTKAELAAISTMNGYLRKRGYTVPLDSPLDEDVKQYVLSIGMEFLTLRSENKVDSIDKNARIARGFFKDVALGRAHIIDVNVATIEGTQNLDVPSGGSRNVTFDFNDPDSEGSLRMPPL